MPSLITPLLETMSAAARTAWPHIQAAATAGLSGNATIKMLQAAGMGVRRQDVYAMLREATGANLLRSDIQRWPANIIAPISRVRTAATKIVAPFGYTVKLVMENPDTGETITVLNTAHSNQLVAFDQVAAQFTELPETASGPIGFSVASATVIDAYQSGAAGVI